MFSEFASDNRYNREEQPDRVLIVLRVSFFVKKAIPTGLCGSQVFSRGFFLLSTVLVPHFIDMPGLKRSLVPGCLL